jgi:hypothetical protein
MNEKIVNKYIMDLNWNKSKSIQQKAINNLSTLDGGYLVLVLPIRILPKDLWENAAIVLKSIGIDKLKSIWIYLFYWLQDINWPGSMIIYDLLRTLPQSYLKLYIDKAIGIAKILEDDDWVSNIEELFKDLQVI